MNEAVNYIEEHIHVKVIDVALMYGYDSPPPLVFQMTVRGTQKMNYRIEKKDEGYSCI